MANFLIGIEYDTVYGSYLACYADGTIIQLGATTYEDAVLETDMIDLYEYEN